MLLSVVVPTYNRADSLRRTLEGLARQEVSGGFEAVVVSDGATDGTAEMVRAASPQLPYPLRFLEQPNSGPSRARNHGTEAARGEIIVYLDDDVEPLPGCLAAHAKHHEQDAVVAVIGPMLPDAKCAKREPPWIAWEHALLGEQYRNWNCGEWLGAGPNHFYTGNASVRRVHVLGVGGFNETFRRQEDVELAYRLHQERGVGFRFEASAQALHRPSRSFESWFKTPLAYGALDVERVRRQEASASLLAKSYHSRHKITRLLADMGGKYPFSLPLLYGALRGLASLTHRLPGGSAVSRQALSALYNVRYLEGVRKAAGDAEDFRCLLRENEAA